MKLIRPETVTDTIFQSSDVPEADYSAWLVGTTYADGDRVIVTTPNIHKIYESQQAANTGNDPTTDDGTWWLGSIQHEPLEAIQRHRSGADRASWRHGVRSTVANGSKLAGSD